MEREYYPQGYYVLVAIFLRLYLYLRYSSITINNSSILLELGVLFKIVSAFIFLNYYLSLIIFSMMPLGKPRSFSNQPNYEGKEHNILIDSGANLRFLYLPIILLHTRMIVTAGSLTEILGMSLLPFAILAIGN